MKKIVEVAEGSMDSLLGEMVLLMCANYFYYGKLTGVNKTAVELSDPKIVYETGDWSKSTWADAQALPCKTIGIRLPMIESYMRVTR